MQGNLHSRHRTSPGSAVYATRCAEMGLVPCSQVVRELDRSTANLAHCKIGPSGAPALAAALAANCTIQSLCLRGSGLDGKSAGVILAALATATAARMTASDRARSIALATTAAAGIGAARQEARLPLVSPPPASAAASSSSSAATAQDQHRSQQRAKSMSVRFSPLALDGDDGDAAAAAGSSCGGGGSIRPAMAGSSTTPASPVSHSSVSFFLPHSPGPATSPHGKQGAAADAAPASACCITSNSITDAFRTTAGSQQREAAIYSQLSELDLAENQLGTSGAKAVAQVSARQED